LPLLRKGLSRNLLFELLFECLSEFWREVAGSSAQDLIFVGVQVAIIEIKIMDGAASRSTDAAASAALDFSL